MTTIASERELNHELNRNNGTMIVSERNSYWYPLIREKILAGELSIVSQRLGKPHQGLLITVSRK